MELEVTPWLPSPGIITSSGIKNYPVFNFEWIFDDNQTQNYPYSILSRIQGKIIVTLQKPPKNYP